MKIVLEEGYIPVESEEYMNPYQLEYFRLKLLERKKELLSRLGSKSTALACVDHMSVEDMVSWESSAGIDVNSANRYLKELAEIDDAFKRIEDGSYGYCEITGDEIGIVRLNVAMTSCYCVEEQRKIDREKISSNDEEC